MVLTWYNKGKNWYWRKVSANIFLTRTSILWEREWKQGCMKLIHAGWEIRKCGWRDWLNCGGRAGLSMGEKELHSKDKTLLSPTFVIALYTMDEKYMLCEQHLMRNQKRSASLAVASVLTKYIRSALIFWSSLVCLLTSDKLLYVCSFRKTYSQVFSCYWWDDHPIHTKLQVCWF